MIEPEVKEVVTGGGEGGVGGLPGYVPTVEDH